MAKNIHEAINNVMKDVGYVKKESKRGLNYSFAGEAALIAALRPSMVKNGIVMSVSGIAYERTEYSTKSGTVMNVTIVSGSVKFTHAETGTHETVFAIGEGADVGDKSANKAMTGMYKYALRQTFMIETGDDPDKEASVPASTNRQPATHVSSQKWESIQQEMIEGGLAANEFAANGILAQFADVAADGTNGNAWKLWFAKQYRKEKDANGGDSAKAFEAAKASYLAAVNK